MSQKTEQSDHANQVVEHFFRHEYSKVIAGLTGKYGVVHIDLIEDAVQEALIKAMGSWPFNEVPKNPSGWIYQVARNHLLDTLKRDSKMESSRETEQMTSASDEIVMTDLPSDIEIQDEELRMMFVCCHPSLSIEYQIVLTLKWLCGFSNAEIASALLKKEDAVAKALTRGKAKLKTAEDAMHIPLGKDLEQRLAVMLKILYLLFNEGYSASQGAALIKQDLCFESIRLGSILLQNKHCNIAPLYALLALMCFQASRFNARINAGGEFVTLENQNRLLWDQRLIAKGNAYLAKASETEVITDYHAQAGIAYYHCSAATFEETRWASILGLYDLQAQITPSPVAALNRIVAFAKVHGAQKGLKELAKIEKEKKLQQYYLFYAIKGELLRNAGDLPKAASVLKEAIKLTQNETEKTFLKKKLETLFDSK
ncbi:MAG: sigma-70 family RNA polymerase sigma factor [Flavobacteriales bacterium]|nr:sigma-70 family RNA polymerase sigma factor [Flavobacteriales bacterium]